jgi:dGTPase
VASVGRSLGKAVGDALAERYPGFGDGFREFYKYELPSVIAAACLAHDIGNPPFGHSGEDAIRNFFRELEGEEKLRFAAELTPNQQQDFLWFEGNANAFRTLTHAFNERSPGGFRLTYATLASIVKYPSDSLNGFNKQQLVTKKSGFFDSEIGTYKAIADEVGIPRLSPDKNVYARHPFVYLVEAADDICSGSLILKMRTGFISFRSRRYRSCSCPFLIRRKVMMRGIGWRRSFTKSTMTIRKCSSCEPS